MTPLIVIQARLGSKRLPGKILMDLGGKSVLQHVVERCQRTGYPVVVACPDSDTDTLMGVCPGGMKWQDGIAEDDVLGRYVAAVNEYPGTELVVRITADCPLVDPVLIEASVQAIREGADYAGNTVERHWPRGCDVESFTTELLMQAHQEATDSYDREHVTPWMQRWASNPIALEASIRPVEARTEWRWCLDTPKDYSWLRVFFDNGPPFPTLEQAAAYSRVYPPPVD